MVHCSLTETFETDVSRTVLWYLDNASGQANSQRAGLRWNTSTARNQSRAPREGLCRLPTGSVGPCGADCHAMLSIRLLIQFLQS